MRKYLRNPRMGRELRIDRLQPSPRPGAAAGPGREGPLAETSTGLMMDLSLLEDASDHQVQRGILHAHIDHRVAVEDAPQDLGPSRALDFQAGHRPIAAGDLTEAFQTLGDGIARKVKLDKLGI